MLAASLKLEVGRTPDSSVHRTLAITRRRCDPLFDTVHMEHMRTLATDLTVSQRCVIKDLVCTYQADNRLQETCNLDSTHHRQSYKCRTLRPHPRRLPSHLCLRFSIATGPLRDTLELLHAFEYNPARRSATGAYYPGSRRWSGSSGDASNGSVYSSPVHS